MSCLASLIFNEGLSLCCPALWFSVGSGMPRNYGESDKLRGSSLAVTTKQRKSRIRDGGSCGGEATAAHPGGRRPLGRVRNFSLVEMPADDQQIVAGAVLYDSTALPATFPGAVALAIGLSLSGKRLSAKVRELSDAGYVAIVYKSNGSLGQGIAGGRTGNGDGALPGLGLGPVEPARGDHGRRRRPAPAIGTHPGGHPPRGPVRSGQHRGRPGGRCHCDRRSRPDDSGVFDPPGPAHR